MHLTRGDVRTILTMRNARGITIINVHAFFEISSKFLNSLQGSNKI